MEIAEKNKNVEKSQALTEFSLGYNNQPLIRFHTGNGGELFYNAGDRFSSVTLGVAIPLSFGAAKAGIQSWEYRKQTAEINRKQRQKQFAVQLEIALNQYKQDVQQYDYYIS